jgi:hypothetical protein
VVSALLLAGCSRGGPYVCGACPGPGVSLRGMPEQIRHATVTACLTGYGCQPFGWRPAKTSQLPLLLPASASWSRLDGSRLRIVIRTEHARWTGTATVRYRAPSSSPCDCGDIHADVTVSPGANPPG